MTSPSKEKKNRSEKVNNQPWQHSQGLASKPYHQGAHHRSKFTQNMAPRDTRPVNPSESTQNNAARKQQKQEWDSEVDTIYKRMKKIWKKWKSNGRKKHSTDRSWKKYKTAKRNFRATLRRSRRKQELSLIKQIEGAKKSDSKLFYKLIKRSRSQKETDETDKLT